MSNFPINISWNWTDLIVLSVPGHGGLGVSDRRVFCDHSSLVLGGHGGVLLLPAVLPAVLPSVLLLTLLAFRLLLLLQRVLGARAGVALLKQE